eukprot:g60237.t1
MLPSSNVNESAPLVATGPNFENSHGIVSGKRYGAFAIAVLLGAVVGAMATPWLLRASDLGYVASVPSSELKVGSGVYLYGKDGKDGSDRYGCEDERCSEDVNGGCNRRAGQAYTETACNTVWGGKAWATTIIINNIPRDRRDTDWYLVRDHPGGEITCSVKSDIPIVCFFVDYNPSCKNTTFPEGPNGHSDGQVGRSFVPPGDYIVFAATGTPDGDPIFRGYPCDDDKGYPYTLTIGCKPERASKQAVEATDEGNGALHKSSAICVGASEEDCA